MGQFDLFMTITSIVFVPIALMMVSMVVFIGSLMHTMLEGLQTQQDMDNMDSVTGYGNNGSYNSTTTAAGTDPV